jgi:hypothetical protein
MCLERDSKRGSGDHPEPKYLDEYRTPLPDTFIAPLGVRHPLSIASLFLGFSRRRSADFDDPLNIRFCGEPAAPSLHQTEQTDQTDHKDHTYGVQTIQTIQTKAVESSCAGEGSHRASNSTCPHPLCSTEGFGVDMLGVCCPGCLGTSTAP